MPTIVGAAREASGGADAPKIDRYEVGDVIGRGGMGEIRTARDARVGRDVAIKLMLPEHRDAEALARFVREAQIQGRLEHPAVVPVHDIGVDPTGSPYFVMKRVAGTTLAEVFAAYDADPAKAAVAWPRRTLLARFVDVCLAAELAHTRGIVHRDLKPANIMLGDYGEVYLLDWGIARSADDPPREGNSVSGTLGYMSPEQARGSRTIDARSDIYALGAILFEILIGRPLHEPAPPAEMLEAIEHGVDARPSVRAPDVDVPPELEAICDKAMARDPEHRYADTLDLADDLRAFLEGRVVKAYQTGAIVELRKWVQRNKPLAASLAAGVLILVAGILVSTAKTREAEAARHETAAKNVDLSAATQRAQENEARARSQEQIATQKTNDVLSLSAIQVLKDLEARGDALWPADPENVPKYEAWLADARVLIEGQPGDPARGLKKRPSLREHEAKLAEIRQRAKTSTGGVYEFEDGEDRWWHEQLSKLVVDLKAFADESAGGLYSAGISAEHGWGVVKRAEFARTILDRSVTGARAKKRWDAAIAAIAASPKYGGLKLAPQLGLLPIGPDPESGLWEFSHLATAKDFEPAERELDGKLVLEDGIGIVFVLIPGGKFRMGAQKVDPAAPNYDAQALLLENGRGRTSLVLGVNNLTNALYAEFANASFFRPEPRRSLSTSLVIEF